MTEKVQTETQMFSQKIKKWKLFAYITLLLLSGGLFLSFYIKLPPTGAGKTGINPNIPQELKNYSFDPDKHKKERP